MISPYNEIELNNLLQQTGMEFPIVAPDGTVVEDVEIMIEDTLDWIDALEMDCHHTGGIEEFNDALEKFWAGYKPAFEASKAATA